MTLLSYRKQNKLTQQEMAGKLKIDQPYYSKIEGGKRRPGTRLVGKIFVLTKGKVGFIVLRPDIHKIMEKGVRDEEKRNSCLDD